MWFANVTIKDEMTGKTTNFKYEFIISTYKSLLKDIKNIYKYEENCQIIFELSYLNTKSLIDDLAKYILNRDSIVIYIRENEIYILTDTQGTELCKSRNMNDVYKYYRNKNIRDECFLFKGNNFQLLDVLDTSENQYNKCVNRLVRKYGY